MFQVENNDFDFSSSQKDLERKFVNFYYDVLIKNFHPHNTSSFNVKDSLETYENLFDASDEEAFESYQIAFLFQHGIHDTCMTVKMFNQSIQKNSSIIHKLVFKSRIRICCMGISSLLSTIGICDVINNGLLEFGFLNDNPVEIQILHVDKDNRWKSLCEYIVNIMNSEYPKIKIKLFYLKDYVNKQYSEKIKAAMQKSHFLIMNRYLSRFSSIEVVEKKLQEIMYYMKKDSIFFYLDTKSNGSNHIIQLLMKKNSCFSEIESNEEIFVPQSETIVAQSILYKNMLPFYWNPDFPIAEFIICVKSPRTKQKASMKSDSFYQSTEYNSEKKSKESLIKLRNSTKRYITENHKKIKEMTYKNIAKEKSFSRYASFDDEY